MREGEGEGGRDDYVQDEVSTNGGFAWRVVEEYVSESINGSDKPSTPLSHVRSHARFLEVGGAREGLAWGRKGTKMRQFGDMYFIHIIDSSVKSHCTPWYAINSVQNRCNNVRSAPPNRPQRITAPSPSLATNAASTAASSPSSISSTRRPARELASLSQAVVVVLFFWLVQSQANEMTSHYASRVD